MSSRATLAMARADEDTNDADEARDGRDLLLDSYLALLDSQRNDPRGRWGAYHELHEIAAHFDLILDVNAPEAREKPLDECPRYVAGLLRQQQPIGGMSGQVNQTLVRQFRMPGYPFVLVTTDLLQEGEDLHLFCSAIHHYGISWTPSAMEQRIGRIDRVCSQTDRRLAALDADPAGEDWLQVYFPYLEDTVEVLQVERVLDRMNTFLRLMHEGLAVPAQDQRRIDVKRQMLTARRRIEALRQPLRSAFPVLEWMVTGETTKLAVDQGVGERSLERLTALRQPELGGIRVTWAEHSPKGTLLGTAHVDGGRVQPFMLMLGLNHGRLVVRCVSPIGRTDPETAPERIADRASRLHTRIGAILTREERSYDLTVEDDALLSTPQHDEARVGLLLRRVALEADRMEREHFEDGRDAVLDTFAADLRKEVGRGE